MGDVRWSEEGKWSRSGTQWGAARADGSFWVLPDTPDRHEIAVLLDPEQYVATGVAWRATWYEDHVRGDTWPHGVPHCPPAYAPYGCVDEDDNTCTLRCARADCGLHVVRPGYTQCWCDDEAN